MRLAGDLDHDLVEVPDIVSARRLAPETPCTFKAELLGPASDRFIGDDDATLQEHLLDKTQAQREPKVKPDGVGDDLRRKAVTLVTDGMAPNAPVRHGISSLS
jgi:hypothetical protein